MGHGAWRRCWCQARGRGARTGEVAEHRGLLLGAPRAAERAAVPGQVGEHERRVQEGQGLGVRQRRRGEHVLAHHHRRAQGAQSVAQFPQGGLLRALAVVRSKPHRRTSMT